MRKFILQHDICVPSPKEFVCHIQKSHPVKKLSVVMPLNNAAFRSESLAQTYACHNRPVTELQEIALLAVTIDMKI